MDLPPPLGWSGKEVRGAVEALEEGTADPVPEDDIEDVGLLEGGVLVWVEGLEFVRGRCQFLGGRLNYNSINE